MNIVAYAFSPKQTNKKDNKISIKSNCKSKINVIF